MEKPEFKKGDYVVLLAACDGENCWRYSIPVNHVYVLREDYTPRSLNIKKDIKYGRPNGWSTSGSYDSKMQVRAATANEIAKYNQNNGPVAVDEMESLMELIEKNIKRLEQENATAH